VTSPWSRDQSTRELVSFFVITFALTWAAFLPNILGLVSGQATQENLAALGIGAPSLTAFVLTAVVAGRRGVGHLWRQGTRWRVGPGWYVFVLGFPALAFGAARLLAPGPDDPVAPVDSWILLAVVGVIVGAFEEFGWMGVAFPSLQARFGFLWAGIAMGVAVAVWHIPFFFDPAQPQASFSFVPFLLLLIPARILFGWVYNGSEGSILLMILLHASGNTWGEILSVGPQVFNAPHLWLIAIFGAAAGVVLLTNRPWAPMSGLPTQGS
jgi:membrane protease YdiL (CAAX protease family)